jgi:hypothetical protein
MSLSSIPFLAPTVTLFPTTLFAIRSESKGNDRLPRLVKQERVGGDRAECHMWRLGTANPLYVDYRTRKDNIELVPQLIPPGPYAEPFGRVELIALTI